MWVDLSCLNNQKCVHALWCFLFYFFLRIYFDLLSFHFSFYFSVKLRHNELLYWNSVYTESSQTDKQNRSRHFSSLIITLKLVEQNNRNTIKSLVHHNELFVFWGVEKTCWALIGQFDCWLCSFTSQCSVIELLCLNLCLALPKEMHVAVRYQQQPDVFIR